MVITTLRYHRLIDFLLGVSFLANGFFIYRLFVRYIQPRQNLVCKIFLYLCFSVSSGMVIWIGDHNLILTVPVFVAVGMFCTKGNRFGRLAVVFTFICMIMPVNATLDTYVREYNYNLLRMVILPNIGRTVMFASIFIFLRRKLPENTISLPERLWKIIFLLSFMPFCTLAATVTLTFGSQFNDIAVIQARYVGAVILPCTFLTSFAIMAAISALADHDQLERRSRLAEMREVYYQSLRQQEAGFRHMRHDMRNHLATVRAMLAGQNQEGAVLYLDALLEGLYPCGHYAEHRYTFARFCENEAANAILQVKATMILQYGLEHDFRIQLPETLAISDIDLCSLIGNALDNAIRAAASAEDKKIVLRCRCDKGIFMMKVQNGFSGELDKDLKTTKTDGGRHGFGISGMREIAARYAGALETQIGEHIFTLVVFFPLPDIS